MDDAGFEIHEGILGPADADALLSALPSAGRAGSRHLMRHPAVSELAHRAALLGLARRYAGPGAVPYRATLFEKSGHRNWLVVWHQDTTLPLVRRIEHPDWGPWSVKDGVTYAHAPTGALEKIVALRVHLDASEAANGPLRVIPGSHRFGVLSDEEVFRRSRGLPAVDALIGRGGVLAMRPLLIHASSKSRSPEPRRVLHLEYAASMELGGGFRLATA